MRNFSWLFLALFLAEPVRASSVSDEVTGGGTSQVTPNVPNAAFLADRIFGLVDLDSDWALKFQLGLTHDFPAPPATKTLFKATAADVIDSALGLEWSAGEQWDFAGEFQFSPQSRQNIAADIDFTPTGTAAQANTLINVATRTVGGLLSAGYDSAGDSDFENDVFATAQLSNLNAAQSLRELKVNGKVDNASTLKTLCAKPKAAAYCREIRPFLRGSPDSLNTLRLAGAFTEILFQDTDVTLSGAFYLYDEDPNLFGYSLFTNRVNSTISLGTGIPTAPLRFSIRPEIAHTFGPAQVSASYQYGKYYGRENGYGHSVGVRVAYRLSRSIRLWISATGQDDLQPPDPLGPARAPWRSIFSGFVGSGMRYRF